MGLVRSHAPKSPLASLGFPETQASAVVGPRDYGNTRIISSNCMGMLSISNGSSDLAPSVQEGVIMFSISVSLSDGSASSASNNNANKSKSSSTDEEIKMLFDEMDGKTVTSKKMEVMERSNNPVEETGISGRSELPAPSDIGCSKEWIDSIKRDRVGFLRRIALGSAFIAITPHPGTRLTDAPGTSFAVYKTIFEHGVRFPLHFL